MCTVSIVPRGDGFRLMCNRDERTSRPQALRPARHALSAREAIYPVDPLGGGTWIGANDAGLAMSVLNRSARRGPWPQRSCHSRGLIIPQLLVHDSLADAMDAAAERDLSVFPPFRLVAIQGREVAVLTWDGDARSLEGAALIRPVVFASSSLGDGSSKRWC
jgi:uncharacterized protein with NRDE domain